MKLFFRWLFRLILVVGLLCLGVGLYFLIAIMPRGHGSEDVAEIVDGMISLWATGIGLVVTLTAAMGLLALGETDVVQEQGKGGADQSADPPPQ